MRKVFMLFLVFLFTLILSELLLRVSWHASSQVRWSLKAPWEKTEFVKDPELNFRGNPDHPEHDAAGFRNLDGMDSADIVGIGDSQTYGVGIRRSESWPKQLGELSGKTVYNMSVSGWGPVQYLGQINQALDLQPDAVVVALYIGNDIYDAYHLAYELEAGAGLRGPETVEVIRGLEENQALNKLSITSVLGKKDRSETVARKETDEAAQSRKNNIGLYLSRHSMLYAMLRGLWYMASGFEDRFTPWSTEPRDDYWVQLADLAGDYPEDMITFESGDVRTILTPAHRLQGINNDDPRIAEGVEVALRALNEMYMHCKKQGAGFLVVILPTKEYAFYPFMAAKTRNANAMEKMRRLARYENEVRKRIFTVLEAKETDYLDMLPVFRDVITQDQMNPYFESLNGHFNALGNKLIARSIAMHFQEENQGM